METPFSKTMKVGRIVHTRCPRGDVLGQETNYPRTSRHSDQRATRSFDHKKILLLFTRRSKCTDISGYEETQVPKFAKISFLWRTFSSFRYKGFAKFIGEPESNG